MHGACDVGQIGPSRAAGQVADEASYHKAVTLSGSGKFAGIHPSSNLSDGNRAGYWESADNAFPQRAQVDLGSAQSASGVVLHPPSGCVPAQRDRAAWCVPHGCNVAVVVGPVTTSG